MPEIPKWRKDPKNEWIQEELLSNYLAEVESDAMRSLYLKEGKSCQRYYNTTKEWWIPTDDDDVDYASMLQEQKIPASTENHVKRSVDDILSLSFKNDPEVRHHPQQDRPEDSELSDDMDALLRMAWKKATVRPSMLSWGLQTIIWGLSSVKTLYNFADKTSGRGDVSVINKSPYDVMYDPLASNSNRALDCRYIIDRSWMSPETVARRLGQEGMDAAAIDASKWFDKLVDKIPIDRLKKMIIVSKNRKKGEDYPIEVLEYWLFPTSKYDNAIIGGQDIEEDDYPYGVIATMINSKIVDIKGNPFAKKDRRAKQDRLGTEPIVRGHCRHPFVPMWWLRCHNIDGYNSFYMTRGAVSAMKPAQISLNGLLNSSEIIARTNANPYTIMRKGATDINLENIGRRPGEVIVLNEQTEGESIDNLIRFGSGQQMSPDIPILIERKTRIIQRLGGISEGMTGQYPGGTSHTTAGGTFSLQEASFTPMWTPTKEFDDAIKDLAELIMGNIQQFYEPGRYVDIDINGEQVAIELKEAHLKTQFQRVVISGATTPMYDVDRDPRMANIKLMVDNAIMQSIQARDVSPMETCVIYLESIKYPPALRYIQLLKKKIDELSQQNQVMDQATTQAGAVGLADQLQQAQAAQEQPSTEEAPNELEDIATLIGDED
jgi:hypothetical protein